MKELWLVITLATTPATEYRREIAADYCEQFVRDYWGAQALGAIYEWQWPDGKSAKITKMVCVNPETETAQRPTS